MPAPHFVPLSLGMGLGMHWITRRWSVGHPLGVQHAVARRLGPVGAWLVFPRPPGRCLRTGGGGGLRGSAAADARAVDGGPVRAGHGGLVGPTSGAA